MLRDERRVEQGRTFHDGSRSAAAMEKSEAERTATRKRERIPHRTIFTKSDATKTKIVLTNSHGIGAILSHFDPKVNLFDQKSSKKNRGFTFTQTSSENLRIKEPEGPTRSA